MEIWPAVRTFIQMFYAYRSKSYACWRCDLYYSIALATLAKRIQAAPAYPKLPNPSSALPSRVAKAAAQIESVARKICVLDAVSLVWALTYMRWLIKQAVALLMTTWVCSRVQDQLKSDVLLSACGLNIWGRFLHVRDGYAAYSEQALLPVWLNRVRSQLRQKHRRLCPLLNFRSINF